MSETKKCGCYTRKNLMENAEKSETDKVDRRRFFSQGNGLISKQGQFWKLFYRKTQMEMKRKYERNLAHFDDWSKKSEFW